MRANTQRTKQTPSQVVRWLWPIRLLLVIALAVDGYLLWVTGAGGTVAGCGPESSCHAVLSSRWAHWFGIPVSAPALLVYAILFTGTLWLDPGTPAPNQRRAWQALLPCTVAVLGAGVWFVALQLFVVKAICAYCMTAHTCGMGAAAFLLWQGAGALRQPRKGGSVEPGSRRKSEVLWPTVGAMAAVAVLVVGQILHKPKTYQSTPITAGVSTNPAAVMAREFQIYNGQFQFQLNEVPLIGKPDAPHVLVSLFDYTCHHCRQVHPILLEAWHQFSNQLAIVSLPMPLDGHCNPRIRRTPPPHTNACALARIGLTVWTADPTKAAAFDDWAFAPENPPLPAAAEAYARQVVGSDAFDKASTNASVDAQIRRSIAIYEANAQRFRKTVMPQVIIGTNLITGVFSREQLFGMLADQFGLKQPTPKSP